MMTNREAQCVEMVAKLQDQLNAANIRLESQESTISSLRRQLESADATIGHQRSTINALEQRLELMQYMPMTEVAF